MCVINSFYNLLFTYWEKIFNKAKEKVVEQSKKKQMSQNKKDRDCVKIVQKRLCNGEKPNCTPPSVSCIPTGFRWLCSCAVAHACTYAQARLKPPFLQVRAVVRLCISIENYRKVCINIHLYLGEIGFSNRNLVRM